MCSKGNQTIYQGCWDEFQKRTGRASIGNKDMQMLLAEEGGCLLGHSLTFEQLDAGKRAVVGARLDATKPVMAK